jgi:hypothetical protein
MRNAAQQVQLADIDIIQAQTPQQRKANAKFAKDQTLKRGKPAGEVQGKSKRDFKSPVSKVWLCELLSAS